MTDSNDYWSDYNRGAAGLPPRDGMFYNMAERQGRDAAFGNNNNGGAGGGGGFLILLLAGVILAAIVAIAAVAALSAVMALPCAYLLIAITALFSRRDAPDFGDAYKTSFMGLAAAATLAGALALAMLEGYLTALPAAPLVYWLAHGDLDTAGFAAREWTRIGLGGLTLLAPGLLVFALLLRKRIGRPYEGAAGFLRGLVASFLVLVLPGLAFGVAAAFLADYAEPAVVRGDDIASFVGVALALVATMAVLGGLVLGLALMAFGGGLAKGGPIFRNAWFNGAVAMALAGGTAAGAIYLFRDADPMLQALIALTPKGMANPPAFTEALPGFLKLAAPGAFAGAFFVAGNLYAYRGVGGWLKAMLITVPLCLAGIAAAIVLVTLALA